MNVLVLRLLLPPCTWSAAPASLAAITLWYFTHVDPPPQVRRLSGLPAAAQLQLGLPAPPALHLRSHPQSSGVAAHLLHAGAGRKPAGWPTQLLPFLFSFHICERRLKLTSLCLGGEQARRRALEEPEYLRGVLLEVQRLWPPFIGGRRLADQVSSSSVFIPR